MYQHSLNNFSIYKPINLNPTLSIRDLLESKIDNSKMDVSTFVNIGIYIFL